MNGKLLKAKWKCHWYLLFKGMWKGEEYFVGYDKSDKVCFVAATTGSIWDGTIKPVKIFYNTTNLFDKI